MKKLTLTMIVLLAVVASGCGKGADPVAPPPTDNSTGNSGHSLVAVPVVDGPIVNPVNGHAYYLLANSDWTAAEKNAVRAFGGHLVTINDAGENTFVVKSFASASGSGWLWLGLNDAESEGDFTYTSGEGPTYTDWEPGEPNNSNNEDYVAMSTGNGRWVDVKDLADPPGIGKVYGVVETDAMAPVVVVQGPVVNPDNGHTYYRLSNSNWSDAEAFAVDVLDGHLVTINDAAENTFVLTTFANVPGSGRVWLGLNDAQTEGTFVYTSGESPTYTNWEPGEPNSLNDEDYVAMYSGNGHWVDVKDLANPPGIGNVYGVVEVK